MSLDNALQDGSNSMSRRTVEVGGTPIIETEENITTQAKLLLQLESVKNDIANWNDTVE